MSRRRRRPGRGQHLGHGGHEVRRHELLRRDVHRHAEVGGPPSRRPPVQVGAGPLEHPAPDAVDRTPIARPAGSGSSAESGRAWGGPSAGAPRPRGSARRACARSAGTRCAARPARPPPPRSRWSMTMRSARLCSRTSMTWCVPPPRRLAWYMAMSASRSNCSGSSLVLGRERDAHAGRQLDDHVIERER